jgi:hypothetical protein
MAQLLGVWMIVNNPNRTTSQGLNITVGGTILLNDADVKKLPKGGLFNIAIKVMDEDTFSDDTVFTDNSFSVGVFDTAPHCFHTGVIVPHGKLNDCEPFWESWAEIYCRVQAKNGPVQTNAVRSPGTVNVAID